MTRYITLVLLFSLTVGCGSEESGDDRQFSGTYPINAVATVGMVADIVRNVGGEHVEVEQLLGAGVDPHLYKATRDDVSAILSGDIVFYSGLMLEGKMSDTFVSVGRTKPVYAVTELIEEQYLLSPEDTDGHADPHVWMDAAAWSKCVDAVANGLAEFDPTNAESYRANADAYQEQLAELDKYGRECIASIPQGKRILVTSHDAFNYFGRAYGLEVMGVQGISTESEAGIKKINELVEMLVEKNVGAVFVESSVSRKSIQSLIEGAQAQGHDVTIGGELFSDAMGKAGTYEGTYVGMLDHNITLVTRALGGEAPERGMQGKLAAESAGENNPEE